MYLTQGLHRSVQCRAEEVATVCGGRVRTFAELADRVARLAGALRGLGVTVGDRVGMLALNSDRYLEWLLAVWWAGAAVNPVNVRWSPAEIAYALEESGTSVLFADDTFAATAAGLRDTVPGSLTLVHCGDGPAPAGTAAYEDLVAGSAAIPDTRTGGDALAGVFYTGGTTGFPKGVMLSHTNIGTSALGSLADGPYSAAGGRWLHVMPMFHLADLAVTVAALAVGGGHVMLPAFEPVAVMESIAGDGVTVAGFAPTMMRMIVDHPDAGSYDFTGLRHMIYGTSPMPPDLLDRAARMFPGAAFLQLYGMTELAPVATVLGPDEHADPVRRRSAGRVAPHAEVRVVGPDDRELPRGTVGEVVCRGDHVMLGYWNRPEETTEALRGGWMHTGDGAYMDDAGYVYIVDRIKDMIITGGENVYSTEVEHAVTTHPAVAACAVIGVPDDHWGERVRAVVVLADGATVTAEEIRAHVKKRIAGYKAPREVEFVAEMPVSPAGKVLKHELRRDATPRMRTAAGGA